MQPYDDLIEMAEAAAIAALEDDEAEGMETFDFGAKIARDVLAAVDLEGLLRDNRTRYGRGMTSHQHEKWMLDESARGGGWMYCRACGETVTSESSNDDSDDAAKP